MAIRQCVDS